MNILNNFKTKKRYTAPEKKSKSTNRALIEKYQLPLLKVGIAKENNYIKNQYLDIINQPKKKNFSQLNYPQKNHKPYSGNPLKFHIKKELNNINGLKYYQERDIFTANPYIAGHQKKKNTYKKSNKINLNELYNKHLIYPIHNNYNYNYNNNGLKNKKNWNLTKKIKLNSKNLKDMNVVLNDNIKDKINPINFSKPSLLNSEEKSNSLNKEIKLRAINPNFNSNIRLIVPNNNNNDKNNNLSNSVNNKSDDMRKTVTERELSNKENEEVSQGEKHIDLCFVSYAYNENPNLEHRKEMEDFHYIKAILYKKISCSYFGLFDGHSGKEVGIYLMENLHKILSQELKSNSIENSEKMKDIVIKSFEKIDKEINSQNYKNETGSTGTVLLLYKDTNSPSGKSILCANVGDSKAYLITKTEMKLITKDHKCNDINEVKRIKDSGGVVFRERVFGTLMLTRSFGDKEMKKYGVLSTPDIFIKNVEKEDLFVVIASDGVWDVVEEDEIFKMSQDNISSNDFSKKIINLAKERDTHDNISCIVIKLNKNN